MLGGFQIFRLRGVPVRVHASLLALAGLLLVLAVAAGGTPAEIALRLLAPLMLFLTVIAHEAGHSLMATRMNIPVLDVVLTPFGGAARLAGRLDDGKKEAVIAAAGPLVNLCLAAAAFAGIEAAGLRDELNMREIFLLEETEDGFYARHPLVAFLGFNLLLGCLNLIPAFPLDGGRVLRGSCSIFWGRRVATRFAARVGFWIAVIFCFAPFFLDGSHWWLLPFIGFFIIYSGFKERLVVEAQAIVMGGSFGSAPVSEDGNREYRSDGSADVIDVEGEVVEHDEPSSRPRLDTRPTSFDDQP